MSPPASLPAGSYTTVTVAGICAVDSGQVVTSGDVTVQPGALLLAAFATDGAQRDLGHHCRAGTSTSQAAGRSSGVRGVGIPLFSDDPVSDLTRPTAWRGARRTGRARRDRARLDDRE